MTAREQLRLVLISSTVSVVLLVGAGYFLMKWGLLRVQVALGEEQMQMFEECRTHAVESSDPKKIAGLMQSAMSYYPSGTKQSSGSHMDRVVERSRRLAVDDMISRLRSLTGSDLGNDPKKWIDQFGERETVQPARATNQRQAKERYIEVGRRVDPQLLEQTDQLGPAWMEERAWLFHSFVAQNEQYQSLAYCHLLLHGGYSVRFKISNDSSPNFITYYFDSKGHIMTWKRTMD